MEIARPMSENGNGNGSVVPAGHKPEGSSGPGPSNDAAVAKAPPSESPDAEPPQKKQRQESEQEHEPELASQQPGATARQPVAPQAGDSQPQQAGGFPADTLFRCQRVVELLLQHPYVGHFNQALGQPNLSTILGWLKDIKGAGQNLKTPADVYTLLTRMFTQFDKVCPADHPLKRVCEALAQHFIACWKHAGLDLFTAHLTNQQAAGAAPGIPATMKTSEAPAEHNHVPQNAAKAETKDRPASNTTNQPAAVARPMPFQANDAAAANRPIIALPERPQAPAGIPQPSREQQVQGLGGRVAGPAPGLVPGQSSQGPPASSLGLSNPGQLAPTGRLDTGLNQEQGLRIQTQGYGAQGPAPQGLAPQAPSSQGLMGRQQVPQAAGGSVDMQRLRAEAEIKPHERAILEQTIEMRRRRAMFEAAAQQAQVAVVQYQRLDQELQRRKAVLAQAKAQLSASGAAQGKETKDTAAVKSEIKVGDVQPEQKAVPPGSQVDANCLLSSNPAQDKPVSAQT